MSEKIKAAWNEWSDGYFGHTGSKDIERLKADPFVVFPQPIRAILKATFPSFVGLRVLVASSGDNGAAFAFHLLGAKVTSSDIAERQLYNAKKIANAQGWDIEFLCADSMTLEGIKDGEYDLVYTSNGVHVWIDDLPAMYRNFHRVLKPGGRYVMFETHPFIRPFDDSGDEIKIIKLYEDTQPHGEDLTYSWRIQDIFNAIVASGFTVDRMEEFHSALDTYGLWWYKTLEEAQADGLRKFDWKQNPWAALPQWIGFSARKGGGAL